MKKLIQGLLLAAALAAAPTAARADVLFELSLGSGARIDPKPTERIATNIMLASGFSFAGMLKLELGLLGNLGDVQNSKFDLSLRPMVVISPPLFPLYLRGIFAVNGLVDGPTEVAYGGALGLSFGLFGIGVFIEAGYLPQDMDIAGKKTRVKLVEGRIGGYWE
jgi:hypothetical protein